MAAFVFSQAFFFIATNSSSLSPSQGRFLTTAVTTYVKVSEPRQTLDTKGVCLIKAICFYLVFVALYSFFQSYLKQTLYQVIIVSSSGSP